MSIEPLFDSFWIEGGDDMVRVRPVAMLSCRRCGVHHVLWPDADDNPPTLAAVVELARQHGEVDCRDEDWHPEDTADG
jgi:hypothetical protein